MKTGAIACGLAIAAVLVTAGCGGVDPEDTATISLAVNTLSSGVRGYTRSDGLHAIIFRSPTSGNILQVLGNPTPQFSTVNLGGNAIAGSTPWGYQRSDHANAVVYISSDLHVHELGSLDIDFTTQFGINAPLAAQDSGQFFGHVPDIIGYIRSDGKNALVYRGSDDHVIEIKSNFEGSPPWLVTDLTATSGGPNVGMGSAFPYVRTDGVNSIVYIATDNRIHELTSNFGGSPSWLDWDLYANSGETIAPATDPWGYKRSDNTNAVVFVGIDGKLHELSRNGTNNCSTGLPWCAGVISVAASPSSGRPSGYIRADGKSAVVYSSSNPNTFEPSLHEVSLAIGGSWVDATLPIGSGNTAPLNGHIFGHRAPGNRSSVLYVGLSNFGDLHGFELSRQTGFFGFWQRFQF